MIYKQKRYLRQHEQSRSSRYEQREHQLSGQLDEIKSEHRKWYDTLSEAKRDRDYDNCHWCLGGSTR